MAKLPAKKTTAGALMALIAQFGPQVVQYVRDHPEMLVRLVDRLRPLTPDDPVTAPFTSRPLPRPKVQGKLDRKFSALHTIITAVQPGDPAAAHVERWTERVTALESKRDVVRAAFTGRDRARRLKEVDAQVDALLQEFLTVTDATIRD